MKHFVEQTEYVYILCWYKQTEVFIIINPNTSPEIAVIIHSYGVLVIKLIIS